MWCDFNCSDQSYTLLPAVTPGSSLQPNYFYLNKSLPYYKFGRFLATKLGERLVDWIWRPSLSSRRIHVNLSNVWQTFTQANMSCLHMAQRCQKHSRNSYARWKVHNKTMLNTVSSLQEFDQSGVCIFSLCLSLLFLLQVLQLPPPVPRHTHEGSWAISCGPAMNWWPVHGVTPPSSSNSLDWLQHLCWTGGWVGCFKFNPIFSLQCRFPHSFPTVGQTGWAPLIFNEKNRKYAVLTENTLTHSSPPPALPFTKSFPDWAVCSFLTMFLLQVRDFLILLWLGLHTLPHCSKECL